MGFSLSNLFDPQGIFSGDKGDIVNNILDPIGGAMQQWDVGQGSDYGDLHSDVGNWMDDMADTNSVIAQRRWKGIKDNPERLAMSGGDLYTAGNPVGTRVNNEIFHREDKPLWDIYGGKTPSDYQAAEDKGINTSASQGLGAVGSSIGKGFLNAYTFGLGSTAMDALNNWGNYDNTAAEDTLKKGAKNYAINYVANTGLDSAGDTLGNTGGYTEQGGGYVGNNEYGGTGGFSLGKSIGAGEYTPAVNATAKGALTGAIGTAGAGGNSSEVKQGALQGGVMQGAKQGIGAGVDYLKNMFNNDEMPDTGTLGGTMSDQYGENSSTLGGQITPEQSDANKQVASTGFSPTMKVQSSQGNSDSPVAAFLSSILPSSGGSKAGGGNYGDLAASAFGMYNAIKQRKALKQQQESLQSLFAPNSPYAQQARQAIERRDAAGGRRSQYGPREAQIAAMLAERQASTFPQQEKYSNAIGGYNNVLANAGLRGAGQLWQMYNKPVPQMNFQPNQGMLPRMGDNDFGVY